MECTICCEQQELLPLCCRCLICSSCMLKSIDVKYFEVVNEISCPGQCTQKHKILNIIEWVPNLNDLLLYKYIKNTNDMRICPRKDCNYGGITMAKCSQFECHCGYKFRVHSDDWNVKNFLMDLLTVRECPKCIRSIYKNGGCNHMTCKCGYEFCWICGQQYNNHNKMQCYSNMTLKFMILVYLLLNIFYQLRLLQNVMSVLIIVIKLLLFNGSLMFFYLGVSELYQISKLNLECSRFYKDGNETFKRIINQKWIMFLLMMAQFSIIIFIFYLWIQDGY